MSESDNLPQGGTDNAQPSTEFDNPAAWDYYDPDEEKQDNVAAPQKVQGTEGETDESGVPAQETEQPEEQTEEATSAEEPEGKTAKPVDDTVTIKMDDGSELTIGELKSGYMLQSDYSRKRQVAARQEAEIGNNHRQSQEILRAAQAYLQSTLPPRPDPALALSDPARFVAMQAQHQQALDALNSSRELLQKSERAERAEYERTAAETVAEQKALMLQKLPSLKAPEAFKKFSEKAVEIGNLAGFTPQEVGNFEDHRVMVLLDYAIEGLAARKARQTAKAKVANVPPAIPKKQNVSTPNVVKNREAMARLSRSGSMQDAMAVDFD